MTSEEQRKPLMLRMLLWWYEKEGKKVKTDFFFNQEHCCQGLYICTPVKGCTCAFSIGNEVCSTKRHPMWLLQGFWSFCRITAFYTKIVGWTVSQKLFLFLNLISSATASFLFSLQAQIIPVSHGYCTLIFCEFWQKFLQNKMCPCKYVLAWNPLKL